MKKFVLAGLMLAPILGSAQKVNAKEIPDAVKEAFSRDHSDVEAKEWEKENNHYEAEFKINGKEQSVVYDAKGQLIESEIEIAPDDLPEEANRYIIEHFTNTRIKEAAKITSASGTVTYEADLGKQDLLFDAQGKFLGTEKEASDDED